MNLHYSQNAGMNVFFLLLLLLLYLLTSQRINTLQFSPCSGLPDSNFANHSVPEVCLILCFLTFIESHSTFSLVFLFISSLDLVLVLDSA
jgi:hypothetical protein